jgi:hypothetical protein
MPKYIDHHENMPPMPPEMAEQVRKAAQSGQANEHGVKVLNAYFGSGGQAYCLTEAPSVDAVVKSHEAMGTPQQAGKVVEVQSLV